MEALQGKCFLGPFALIMGEMALYCHSQLRYGHTVFSLWIYHPTSPCPTHSAHAEPISQGHLLKVIGYSTYIKLKVS